MYGDDILKAELKQAIAECERLRAENAQLKARLRHSPKTPTTPAVPLATSRVQKKKLPETLTANSKSDQKVIRFRRLFRGRDDVYAVRWEGKNGRTGYSPAGIREWEQPAFTTAGKKKPFRLSKSFPLSYEAVRDHLLGKQTIGIYPLLQDDTCWFVAVDFDKRSWEGDACAFLETCRETGVPASLERSRSGNGGHVWIFFAEPVQAALARKLASAVLTRTMERRYALGLDSYDRLFPSQDTMPKGGFGNLIALPLQHDPREKGNSVFVDDQLRPYDDQWAHVSSIKRLTRDETQSLLRKVYPTGDVINVNTKRFVGPISCEFVDRFCLRGKTVRESSYLAGCAAAINQRTRSKSDYVITRKRSPYLPQMKQRHAGKSTKPSYFGWILRVKLQTPIFSSG